MGNHVTHQQYSANVVNVLSSFSLSLVCDLLKVEDHKNGSYGVTYSPSSVGMHKVSPLQILCYGNCFHTLSGFLSKQPRSEKPWERGFNRKDKLKSRGRGSFIMEAINNNIMQVIIL